MELDLEKMTLTFYTGRVSRTGTFQIVFTLEDSFGAVKDYKLTV